MDKHQDDFIVGVPNRIESYSNQKVFVREKEDSIMAKRTELKCPLCGAVQMRVKNCKEAELICHGCGASLLISKDEDGSCYVSARPASAGVRAESSSGTVKRYILQKKNPFAIL